VKRTKCGSCSSEDLYQFLSLAPTPLADVFPDTPAADEIRYPLGAMVCQECWLVQLSEIVPDELLYGADYGFYTGASPSSLAYFEDYATSLLIEHTEQAVKGLVVEIACNDGTLLQHLAKAGCQVLGVEPAAGPAAAARATGLNVMVEPFSPDLARRIVAVHGQASMVIAKKLLAPGGVISIEVQYVADLLLGNGFDLLYHEHRYFFSIGSLTTLLASHDLNIVAVQRTPAQGGSIRVQVRHQPRGVGFADRVALHYRSAYSSMQLRAEQIQVQLRDLIQQEQRAGRVVVGYGAPAKSCTLLNWIEAGPDLIEVIHDATPSKDGRFTPGTHIPITTNPLPAGYNVTAVLLAHNYLPGVLRREREFLDAGGRFIVPLPVPVVI
jgi:hypothetical protein